MKPQYVPASMLVAQAVLDVVVVEVTMLVIVVVAGVGGIADVEEVVAGADAVQLVVVLDLDAVGLPSSSFHQSQLRARTSRFFAGAEAIPVAAAAPDTEAEAGSYEMTCAFKFAGGPLKEAGAALATAL
jgi:hypothetical protein